MKPRASTRLGKIELPVKLKVHESVFVPLAKWAMLIAGNYRCVTKEGPRAIKDAVHSNLDASRVVYQWVVNLCTLLGAKEKDLVPFEKYAAAAQSLGSPSSAARALFAGAPNIERVDRLVQAIAKQKGMQLPILDEVVRLVDARLELNRKKAPRSQDSVPELPAFVVFDAELLDLAGEGVAPHAEQVGGLDAAPAGVRQRLDDQRALELAAERIEDAGSPRARRRSASCSSAASQSEARRRLAA